MGDTLNVYDADEIDTYLDYLAKTMIEGTAKEITKHCLGGNEPIVPSVEEIAHELEKSKWLLMGEFFGGTKTPTGSEISKRQAAAIHNMMRGER